LIKLLLSFNYLGADEQNCTDIMPDESTEQDGVFDIPYFPNSTQCNEWTFKCTNGQCIPYWWKCDGSKDCSDQSDELECENPDGKFFICF
jgi:hypothetical protein